MKTSQLAAPTESTTAKVESKQKRILQTIIFPIILFGVFVLIWITTETEQLQQQVPTGDVAIRTIAIAGSGGSGKKGFGGSNNKGFTPEQCTSLCTTSKVEPSIITSTIERKRYKKSRKTNNKENVYDILDRSKLLDRVNMQKTRLISQLRDDYGPIYFQKMFVDSETNKYRPFIPITPDGPSLERFKRKLLMKVLSVQSKLLQQQSVNCDCNIDDGDNDNDTTKTDDDLLAFERFIHATGGHSSSAGHGNLFNESYTAIMTNDLQPIFESIGIDFEGYVVFIYCVLSSLVSSALILLTCDFFCKCTSK
jgi:hypothetical protein